MAIEKNSIPYAKALFNLSVDKKNTVNVKADAIALMAIANGDENFKDIIKNPTISNTTKSELLQKIFQGKLQQETLDFLQLLVRKGRLSQLASICEALIFLVNQSENLAQVTLTTAYAISDTEKKQIADKFLGSRKYEVESVVKPSIVGGFILEFDHKILDNSISTQLQTLKNNLTH